MEKHISRTYSSTIAVVPPHLVAVVCPVASAGGDATSSNEKYLTHKVMVTTPTFNNNDTKIGQQASKRSPNTMDTIRTVVLIEAPGYLFGLVSDLVSKGVEASCHSRSDWFTIPPHPHFPSQHPQHQPAPSLQPTFIPVSRG